MLARFIRGLEWAAGAVLAYLAGVLAWGLIAAWRRERRNRGE